MHPYPKQILSIQQQIKAYKDAGMNVSSDDEAKMALTTIGYYRLRGYCFHLYDNATKKYQIGTNFSDILRLYQFDTELSRLLFGMTSMIEVALRARLSEALLTYNDALILMDPAVFCDKKIFWQNLGTLSAEIGRSNDVFIIHNYQRHDGAVPLWAAVEVMSFGTLSKIIKNLSTGNGSAFQVLADYYCYVTPNGNSARPSKDMLSSWIHSVSILRNMCAHNGRIYNRTISTAPRLITIDQINPAPSHNGLYQVILAMKYLRPTDDVWNRFVSDLNVLISKYQGIVDISKLNFPFDWTNHFTL